MASTEKTMTLEQLGSALKAVNDELAENAKAIRSCLTQDEKRAYRTGQDHQGIADGAAMFCALLMKKLGQ